MQRLMRILLFLALLCVFVTSEPLHKSEKVQLVQKQLETLHKFFTKSKEIALKQGLGDRSLECAICGIVVNEVEGFMAENLTLEEMESILQNEICWWLSGDLETLCDQLMDALPLLVEGLENHYTITKVCMDAGYCDQPYDNQPDPVDVPRFILNLDLPPRQRWTQICAVPKFQNLVQWLVNTISSILPDKGVLIEDLGETLNKLFPPEYADEINGCAASLGVGSGWVTIFNLGYEVTDACTSIVAETTSGKIYHARNLDFWDGAGFTDTLRNLTIQVDVQRGGKTLFTMSGFPGYVGVLSAIKPGGFSLTVDTRFYPDGVGQLLYEVIAALEETNASLVTFLTRSVVTNANDFESAIQGLSNTLLIADVYYIVAGVSHNQGAVISRNRINATDVWRLDTPSRWFLVETNYDHWEEPPWFDDRVKPANDGMNAIGQQNLTLDGMLQVLSTKPVLNLQTTYSILSCPADGTYKTFGRYCNFPCVE